MLYEQIKDPLSADELDLLQAYLENAGLPTMNIEMLDGFLAALACDPSDVAADEFLPHVFAEDHAFESFEQGREINLLIVRHCVAIHNELNQVLTKEHVYMPVLLNDENGVAHGNDWASGFLRGTMLRPHAWNDLLDDEQHGGSMVPILMLAHEHDPDPELRSPEITPEKREEILKMVIGGLTHIYRYFEPHRQDVMEEPLRRYGPKVGRNDPCPCGSGKKYKRCCDGVYNELI